MRNYIAHRAEQINHKIDKHFFIQQLQTKLKPENIITTSEELRAYDSDALSLYQVLPWLVVLPETTE